MNVDGGETWFGPKNRIALRYGTKFPVSLPRVVNLSHLTDSYAICCMLSTGRAAFYPKTVYLMNANLPTMEPYVWACFVHHIEKYFLKTLGAD